MNVDIDRLEEELWDVQRDLGREKSRNIVSLVKNVGFPLVCAGAGALIGYFSKSSMVYGGFAGVIAGTLVSATYRR